MSTLEGYLLSPSERLFLRNGIRDDLRFDGRQRLSYRALDVEYGPVPQAAGSTRIRLGSTEVLVAVKGDICDISQQPGEEVTGSLTFTVDTSCPSISQLREYDDRTVRQEECKAKASMISRIFEGCFDLKQLVIAEGRFVWVLFVDILIINDEGNLYDTIVCGVGAALSATKLPKVMIEEGEAVGLSVSDDPSDLKALECDNIPVSITFGCYTSDVDFLFVLDPNSAEESAADCLVTVCVDAKQRITFAKKHFGVNSTDDVGWISHEAFKYLITTAHSLGPSLISESRLVAPSFAPQQSNK